MEEASGMGSNVMQQESRASGTFLLSCGCDGMSDKTLMGQTVSTLCGKFSVFIYDILIVLIFPSQFFPYLFKNR